MLLQQDEKDEVDETCNTTHFHSIYEKKNGIDKLSQNFIELLNDKELENVQPNDNYIKKITKPSISTRIFYTIPKQNFNNLENYCNDIIAKIVQNLTLPTNLEEWNKENFLTLKSTLQQCSPYICYFTFQVLKFLIKLDLTKKLLINNINQHHHLVPEQPVQSKNSTWIDCNTTSTNNSYKFELKWHSRKILIKSLKRKNIFGVLPYIAPEVLSGEGYTKAADVYSFGIIAYEIITGFPPYPDTHMIKI
ncbi:hypothetical protein Glove_750g46 [Diversispora epigaea]|uniref:Protein kinase domain-containing protein n=1 Tax=Diversispora epigaea TaxID=1348612 RepID=A0A397G803_9GLOM|nr:hypothetical protein Glove_750g46 [Diversispora epigaea]